MTVSLACCICGYLFLIHCFCFFFLCLLASVVMKTDIKLLNIKEVMEKEMVRDNISREREVEKQEQSHHGGKPKAASAG